MSRNSKSQWDFGELFPPEATRRVLTVSELTTQVKRLLEKQIGQVWVSGEITNFRAQSSGHIYFTLKDTGAQLSCVLFRGESVPHRDLLADGQRVLLQGEVTVYEARGQYQLLVRAVELQGMGVLQATFERLKQKLAAEGLFASERKRPLPRFPRCLGLVTSPTGAAIRDILHVIKRRHPRLQILLAPCRVQGEGAAPEVARAIALLNEYATCHSGIGCDLILVTRGGGSLEDLWCFNEETVARAIFESALPVVSGVGHEIDFTICDFVADLRAATPSTAAEVITEHFVASREFVVKAPQTLRQCVRKQAVRLAEAHESLASRLMRAHPRRRMEEWEQRLDDLRASATRSIRSGLEQRTVTWQHLAGRLLRVRPKTAAAQKRQYLQNQIRLLGDLTKNRWRQKQTRFDNLSARLRLLGPEQVLARGYSITRDAATGTIVRNAEAIKRGQRLLTRVQHGEIRSTADE